MTEIMTIETAQNNLKNAQDNLKDYEAFLFERRKNEFLAAGGCDSCWGHGTVCVWGTMDSMTGCFDEFGACPECGVVEKNEQGYVTKRIKNGPEQPWHGANHGRLSGHPRLYNLPPLAVTDTERHDLETAKFNVKNAEYKLHRVKAQWKIIKGSRVKVTRGRKTPKGTEGVVFWIGEGRTNGPLWCQRPVTRVGIKTDDGVTHWVNDIDYCELLNPRTEAELDAARQAAKLADAVIYEVSKGSEIVSERVSGKVAWAGYTKRGEGPWRALVKAGKDFWLEAGEITEVNGRAITV